MVVSKLNEEVANLVIKYANKVKEVIDLYREGLEKLNMMRVGEAQRVLADGIRADTDADNIRREILVRMGEEVKEGYVREALGRLIRRLDLISELAKEAARYLTIMPYLEIPADIRDAAEELSRVSSEAIKVLVECIKALMEGDFRKATESAVKVEELEEEADKINVKARKLLVNYGETFKNPALVIMIKDFIESLENITDYAEDAADYVRTLAIRFKTA